MTEKPDFQLTISPFVLKHLGIGLYSNVPAVLSEIVANAWDADATKVTIDVDAEASVIVIEDTGVGMDQVRANNRFLKTGYQKRNEEGEMSANLRPFMGRKGIGTLSVFSIARFVTIISKREGAEAIAFRMDRDALEMSIAKEGDYYPERLEVPEDFQSVHGTRIVLQDIDKQLTSTAAWLRKRLAKRFSTLGSADNFVIEVDGAELDRGDLPFLERMQFVWLLGTWPDEKIEDWFPNALETKVIEDTVVRPENTDEHSDDEEAAWRLCGWVGTVYERQDIGQDNGIVLYARKKLIHEDLLAQFAEGGVYTKYIIGQIDAEFMDQDALLDIVTSDRQRVKENDPRTVALQSAVHRVLLKIQSDWKLLRRSYAKTEALQNTVLREWYDRLPKKLQTEAEKLLSKVESLQLPDPESKLEMYRSSLLAFEKLSQRSMLDALQKVETEKDFELLMELLGGVDGIEEAHYYDIVRGRLRVIEKLQEHVDDDVLERVLQDYLFEHLWLLDPSWERAGDSEIIEERVATAFSDAAAKSLSADERTGRVDIRYRTVAGQHVIVELKRASVSISAGELVTQVQKYRNALIKCLRGEDLVRVDENPDISIVCVLGKPLKFDEFDGAANRSALASYRARAVTYQRLVRSAQSAYSKYIDASKSRSTTLELMERFADEYREQHGMPEVDSRP